MPTVHFTSHLQSFVACDPVEVEASDVSAALSGAFAGREKLKSYILDEQGRLRPHIMVFVDGQMIVDRVGLSDTANNESEVYVMQALSGG